MYFIAELLQQQPTTQFCKELSGIRVLPVGRGGLGQVVRQQSNRTLSKTALKHLKENIPQVHLLFLLTCEAPGSNAEQVATGSIQAQKWL